jgi:hypothetical protein
MEASSKLIVIQARRPAASYPAFLEKLRTFPHSALCDSTYIIRTRLTVHQVADELCSAFGDHDVAYFVSELRLPCVCRGPDVAMLAAMKLLEKP